MDYGAEDDRGDHHLHQFNETIPQGLQRYAELRKKIADENTQPHRQQNLNIENAVPRRPPVYGGGRIHLSSLNFSVRKQESNPPMNIFRTLDLSPHPYQKISLLNKSPHPKQLIPPPQSVPSRPSKKILTLFPLPAPTMPPDKPSPSYRGA